MNLQDYHHSLEDDGALVFFRGKVSDGLLEYVLNTTTAKLENEGEDLMTRKKVFHVVVESLQNLINHAPKAEFFEKTILAISRKDQQYIVSTGNVVSKNRSEQLRESLNRINELDSSGLRKHYMNVLDSKKRSIDRGAGVGLIDMAKRSGEKIDYEFQEVTSDLVFFTMSVKVNK